MSINTQTPKTTTQHPLETVFKNLNYLIKSLETELDVAPTDRVAHQDLLRKIHQIAAVALQIPHEAWPTTVTLPEGESRELTPEEQAFFDSIEWVTDGEIGQEIDVDAINRRLKERGYEIQLSFPETPES